MAKKVEIEVDVSGNVVESTANLRKLKTALKEVPAGTAEWNKIKNQIRDVEDSLESASTASEDFKGLLEAAPGPLGMLGKGIKSVELATKSFGGALKAIGIGLLVSTIGLLVAAFSKTEGSMKKLEPLLVGLEQIFGGIVEVFTPLLDAFLDMALTALPYITKGIGVFYSSLYGLFTLLKEAGVGAGKILKGIFTLDFDSVSEGYEQIKNSVTTALDAGVKSMDRFEQGTKKLTKTEKENLEERKAAAQAALDAKIKRMETENKLDEAQLKKLKAESMALATTEQEKLDVEKKFAELSYQALLKDIDDKQKLYKKDSLEYKNLQTEKINAEASFIESLTGFKEKQAAINQAAIDKEKENLNKKQADERQLLAIGFQNQINELDRKNALNQLDFEQDLERLKEKRALLDEAEKNELANTELTEVQKTEIRDKYAAQRRDITQKEIDTERAANEVKLSLQNQYVDAVGQFGNLLQQIAGKNKKLAIAGLIIEQAAGIAKIILNTKAANAIAVGASPLTFGQPWVTINTISAGLGIAASIAAAAKGISQINSTNTNASPAGGSGGRPSQNLGRNYEKGGLLDGPRHSQGGIDTPYGELEGGEFVVNRESTKRYLPLLQDLNSNRNTRFTDSLLSRNPLITERFDYTSKILSDLDSRIPQSKQAITKTYIVESELTSMQQRQARLKDLSTL